MNIKVIMKITQEITGELPVKNISTEMGRKMQKNTSQTRIYLIRQVREGRLTKLPQTEASGCPLHYQVLVPPCLDASQLFDSLQA